MDTLAAVPRLPTTTWLSEQPLDLAAATARYARWGGDPVNLVRDGAYYRVLGRNLGAAAYRAHQEEDGTVVIEADDREALAAAAADLRFRMAEHLPYRAVAELAAADPVVGAALRRRPGFRPALTPDPFEMVVGLITAQQVNLTWANTTRSRLVERYGAAVEWQSISLWQFPGPDELAAADPGDLRALQFTWSKATSIVGVARAAAAGRLDGLAELSDHDAVARVTELRGVGRWTADWLLARCLARPRAVAAGDLGVQKAVGGYLGLDRKATGAEVREVAAGWGDAANWATQLLLEELSAG